MKNNTVNKAAVLVYSNIDRPYLENDTLWWENEKVKRHVSIALDDNEFLYYMSLSPQEKIKYLEWRTDFNF